MIFISPSPGEIFIARLSASPEDVLADRCFDTIWSLIGTDSILHSSSQNAQKQDAEPQKQTDRKTKDLNIGQSKSSKQLKPFLQDRSSVLLRGLIVRNLRTLELSFTDGETNLTEKHRESTNLGLIGS